MLKTNIKQNGNTNPPVFYHDKILSDESSTVTVFLHTTNNTVEEVGKGVLNSPLLLQTTMDWSSHRSWMENIAAATRNTIMGVVDAFRDVSQGITQIVSSALGKSIVSGSNKLFSQTTLVGGDGLHLKYQGSNSNLMIPDVTFVFINTNDTNDYLDKCSKLLKTLLPKQKKLEGQIINDLRKKVGSKIKKALNERNEPKRENFKNADGTFDEIAYSTAKAEYDAAKEAANNMQEEDYYSSYGYLETPPGDLHDINSGYTMKGIWGYFSLKIGFKELYYLVPTNVRIQMSQTGSCFGSDKFWRPHFIYVTVGFTRIGKIFSQDMYHKLLYTDKLNTDQL